MSQTVTVDAGPTFSTRGPLSALLSERIGTEPAADDASVLSAATDAALAAASDVLADDDIQLALFTLYAVAYGSFGAWGVDREFDPALLAVRARLEAAFERQLRAEVTVPPIEAHPSAERMAEVLFELTAPQPGPGLARFIEKKATAEQVREMLVLRSIYTLREADPHSWAIPRLTGAPKAALVEIQSDEYGGGRPERMHSTLFAAAMRGAGLDDSYGRYVDDVPAVTLASLNLMSMFGLNRRFLGAIVGHLAAFEMTSSLPSRRYAEGMRRLGFGPDVTEYYDEHVEADAVHEQIAGRDLAGGLGEQQPQLVEDIMFGAAACLTLDDRVGDHISAAWEAGRSALRDADGRRAHA